VSYPPIAGHGLIGDLQTAALVATDGTIDWFCCPRFDSPSVFAALLDDSRGGRFSLAPVGSNFTTKQMYLPDTAILVTRHLSESGIAEVLDFMPIGDPTVVSESRRIVRAVRGIRGEVQFEATVAPRFDYGRQDHKVHVDGETAVFEGGGSHLHLSSLSPLERDGNDVRTTFSVRAGEVRGFMLEWSGTGTTSFGGGRVVRSFEETAAFWRDWIEQSTYRGRWREAVERSAITLKLMTYAPSGALVAAPTAGLPEQVGGTRNWDSGCETGSTSRQEMARVRSRSCTASTAAPICSRSSSITSRATWARVPFESGTGRPTNCSSTSTAKR
jgi:GH15 family glucan-1,4-alpha-glucosidase